MDIQKVYARKTLDGETVIAENFEDLDFDKVTQVIVSAKKFEQLLDKLDDVLEYARRNPTSAPQCVLDLVADLANH